MKNENHIDLTTPAKCIAYIRAAAERGETITLAGKGERHTAYDVAVCEITGLSANEWASNQGHMGRWEWEAGELLQAVVRSITGHEAIELAEEDSSLILAKYEDPTEGPRVGLNVQEAQEVAAEDPNLIYLYNA